MITILLLSFCLVSLIVASLLIAWFESTLPVHVIEILRRLGFGKSNKSAWENFSELTTYDWQAWLFMYWSGTPMQVRITTLLTCSICLSFHLAFWSSLTASLVLYYAWIATPLAFLLIPICTFGCPIVSGILYHLYTKTDIK